MKYKVGDRVKIKEPELGFYAYNTDIEEILQKTNRILMITEVAIDSNYIGPGYYVKEMGSMYRWYDKDIKYLVEIEKSEPSLMRWQILDIRE